MKKVDSREDSLLRNNKRLSEITGGTLYVDYFNVVLTIGNYLYGRPVFISTDGFLRDAGAAFNEKRAERIDAQSRDFLLRGLPELSGNDTVFVFYLDAPVSRSGEAAAELNRLLETAGIRGSAKAVKSPDFLLKNTDRGVIATSDSVIIRDSAVQVFDLARYILKDCLKEIPDLRIMLKK